MKTVLIGLRLFLALALLSLFPTIVCAASITDSLPLSPLPIEEKEDVFQFRKISSVPEAESILAFDVSDEAGILLITTSGLTNEHHLWYMKTNGDPIAVYSFACNGEVGVAWDGMEICVFYTRGGYVAKLDCDGTLKELLTLTYEDYQTGKTWKALAHREEKEVRTGKYLVRAIGYSPLKNMYDYSELVFTDRETGKETILYNVKEAASGKSWFLFILIVGFVITVICVIVIGQKKNRRTIENDREPASSNNS